MSIEQKIAELLAESKKAQEAPAEVVSEEAALEEERVKPNGKEGGSNSAKENAVSADSEVVRKSETAVKPTDGEDNPDNARNDVKSQDEAEDATEQKSNPANSSATGGDQAPVRKSETAVKGMKEDMDALFSGEELSEEFQAKATTIFESAVMVRVKSEVARLEEEFAASLEEETAKQIEGLVEQVDGYLGYIAEQWMKNNELALENGIKSEIVESFINGMKGLFEEHYIDVPDEKYDVIGEMEQSMASLEAKLNESVEANIALTKQIADHTRASIVAEAAEGLSDVEAEKFAALAEELTFETADEFSAKVKTIRESYFNDKKTAEVKSVVTDSPVEELTESVKTVDPKMSAYLTALNNK